MLSFRTLTILYLFGQYPPVTTRELVFVQAIWRHGERAPSSLPYPKDPYTESVWPRGWKQLTNEGIRQMNELGTYFRQRYDFFVSSHYDSKQVYVRSSDVDRALMSAQAFLSGFYPAEGSFQWQTGNSWQPVPVHSASPGEPDLLLKPSSTACGLVKSLINEEYEKQANYYDNQYAELFTLLSEQSGITNFSYTNMGKIYGIQIEIDKNLTEQQPGWVNRRWPQYRNLSTLEIINDLQRVRRISKFNGTIKSILRGGYLLNDWMNNALKVANGSMKKPGRMLLYSAHEGTLLSLMYAMDVANDRLVPYASSLIMEIYKNGSDYDVELLYRNETTKAPYLLDIEGCQSPCTVKKFFKKYGRMVINSYGHQQVLCGTLLGNCNGSSLISYP